MNGKPSWEDATCGFASPPCGMHEAGDVYMGYLPRDEIVSALGDLLGYARILAEESSAAGSTALRYEAACWCTILTAHIERMNATAARTQPGNASPAAAYDRIGHILRATISKVRDDNLHADLTVIFRSHAAHK